jgi:hypothetical protein
MITAKISDTILDILTELPPGKALDLETLAIQTNANLPKIAIGYHLTNEHCNWLLNHGYVASQAHPLDPNKQLWSVTITGRVMAEQF